MNGSPPRILVVDDDAEICDAYDQILRAHGFEVTTAQSRAEAMAALDQPDADFEVLILDIALPDADGADVAHEIAARLGQRPTLYVSGWTDEFWNLSDAPGRWLVMQKPISVPRLLEAIDWLVGRRPSRPD
ncbi:MAG TPA: response regulator [Gemmatimonadaceae bacterium]|nr:response regulator [Gemmatimonadaceae bacterium]